MDDLNTLIAYSRKNALRRLIRCLFAENILDRSALAFTHDGQQATYPLKQNGAQLFFVPRLRWARPTRWSMTATWCC